MRVHPDPTDIGGQVKNSRGNFRIDSRAGLHRVMALLLQSLMWLGFTVTDPVLSPLLNNRKEGSAVDGIYSEGMSYL